ncbi:MAG: hypothetical protein GX923_07825 [Clostridia bacterium]|nr:hypothetical protein [Clostridia bacterium]
MYYVNRKLISVFRLAFPVGICLATGYILEGLRPVANYSLFFLLMAFIGNYYFPEIVTIKNKKLGIKTILAKECKEFEMGEDLKITVDKKGSYLILHLDRKYMLEIATMSKDLFYQLRPYVRIR